MVRLWGSTHLYVYWATFNFSQRFISCLNLLLCHGPWRQNCGLGSSGDFVFDWDSQKSQDVVLRRKCETGEEVAVSALLGKETSAEEGVFPREARMKVCIKKPGLSSILQFDCGISSRGDSQSEFDIHNAYYLQSPTSLGLSVYRGPLFSTLDPELQEGLKEYLLARGIGQNFTNFLLQHLHKKEQAQYVSWLYDLEKFVAS